MDTAPPSVQAEQRVRSGHQVDAGDGVARQQIPVHGIAEGLIEPHAVLVHGKTLRKAKQRRAREPAKLKIGLKRIRRRFVDVDAWNSEIHLLADGDPSGSLERVGRRCLNVAGNLVAIDAEPVDRSRADDLDGFLEFRGRLLLA
jgi:hypothetical protein